MQKRGSKFGILSVCIECSENFTKEIFTILFCGAKKTRPVEWNQGESCDKRYSGRLNDRRRLYTRRIIEDIVSMFGK